MAGQKNGRTLFHRILSATAMGLISTTVVEWHLKVKDTDYDVSLTKKILYHSQDAKNQLNSYTYS